MRYLIQISKKGSSLWTTVTLRDTPAEAQAVADIAMAHPHVVSTRVIPVEDRATTEPHVSQAWALLPPLSQGGSDAQGNLRPV